MTQFRTVIGLELHVQLSTRSKLFSRVGCKAKAAVNSLVDPVSAGLPGSLPVLNARAVDLALRLAVALDMRVHLCSGFDRKHYFYPDLPKNYQITQHTTPLAEGGELQVLRDGWRHVVALQRLHLEEDAARSLGEAGGGEVDLNRAGCALVELVTEPCIARPDLAGAFLEDLRGLVRWLEVSDANMEDGQLRCDANVSVVAGERRSGRVELKNLNSISAVVRGLEFEARRLGRSLERGEESVVQTRRWNAAAGCSERLRDKETSREYMFLAEPDLPPLRVRAEDVGRVRAELGELPATRRQRLARQWGLPEEHLDQLLRKRELSDYLLGVAEALAGHPQAAVLVRRATRWMVAEWSRELARSGDEVVTASVSPRALARWLAEVEDRPGSHALQARFLELMFREGRSPGSWPEFVASHEVAEDEVRRAIAEVILASEAQVRRYREGKIGLLDYFVGRVLRAAPAGTDPAFVRAACREELDP